MPVGCGPRIGSAARKTRPACPQKPPRARDPKRSWAGGTENRRPAPRHLMNKTFHDQRSAEENEQSVNDVMALPVSDVLPLCQDARPTRGPGALRACKLLRRPARDHRLLDPLRREIRVGEGDVM